MMFSIIIPVYNVEKYIERCIKSILVQTFQDFELLIIDDGSTDYSLDIAKKYQNNDRIKIFSHKNSGTGAARNLGIDKAIGEYCVFVDGDDYIENSLLEMLSNVLKLNTYDAILFNSRRVDEDGHYICDFEMCANFRGEIQVCKYPEILTTPTAPWNKVFSTKLIKDNNVRFSEGITFEDTAFSRILLSKAKKVYVDEGIYYNYVQRKTSAVNTSNIDKMMDIIPADMDLIDAFRECEGEKYTEEIEYIVVQTAILYIVLTINSIDYSSPKQNELCDFVIENFPDFDNNKYLTFLQKLICKVAKKYKFGLLYLLFGFAFKVKRNLKIHFANRKKR